MKDYRFTVELAWGQLLGEGFPLHFTLEEEIEKARLTRRAAYLINQLDSNIGLLSKTEGNQIDGLSVDIIIDRISGEFADVASSQPLRNGVRIIPVWVPKQDKNLIDRWVQPTRELAGLTDSTEPVKPPIVIPPTIDTPEGTWFIGKNGETMFSKHMDNGWGRRYIYHNNVLYVQGMIGNDDWYKWDNGWVHFGSVSPLDK